MRSSGSVSFLAPHRAIADAEPAPGKPAPGKPAP
jgi:hypothetical protein